MAINQLEDHGAVIGYKPDLQYRKEMNNQSVSSESQQQTGDTDYSGQVQYSTTLSEFSNNLPSTALGSIDFAIKNMKLLVDKLSKSFHNGQWNQYGDISMLLSAIESNNQEYIDAFIEKHHNEITGSIVPELIGTIHDTEERLKELSRIVKWLYYGDDNIPLEQAKEIDDGYLKRMKSYETSGEVSKINYLGIAYDSILNRSISMYSYGANRRAIKLADIVNRRDKSSADSSKASFIQKMFKEVNSEIDYRTSAYEKQQSIEIMRKTLYNYYSARRDIINLYSLMSESPDSIYFGRKVAEYQSHIDQALDNINRTFSGNQYYLSEMAKLEQEKHFLMNIYATFNYNSSK